MVQVDNCCLLMERQSQKQDSWANQLDLLNTYGRQTIDFLENYNSFVSKRSPPYRHPLNAYIKAWRLFSEQINSAVKRYKQTKVEVLMSTLINWAMPSLATSYNDLFVYIKLVMKEQENKQENQELNPVQCKEIADQFQLAADFAIKDPTVENILKVPFVFIERFLEKALTFSEHLERRIKYLEGLGQLPSQELSKQINNRKKIMNVELKELLDALNQFNSYLEFLNMKDEGNKQVNRDNTVLKFTIVSKQYPEVPKIKKTVTWAFRLKLIWRWKKLEIKRVQRLKKRKMSILQLIDGEQKYIAGLNQYIDQIKKPISDLDILSEEQRRLLFSSIVEIRDFHESMYSVLRKQHENYSDSQCYGLILKKFFPFFKLYTDYILNATAAQKFLQDLSKSNKQVGEICRKYTELTSKVAHNELSQPTFRIARYQMLLQSIIKNTNSSHPDRQYLSDCLRTFSTILMQVNNEVDKIIRRNRLNQIDMEFGAQEPIYVEGREFLKQFVLSLIKEPMPVSVNLIICTDLLLIVEEDTRKVLKRIKVDQKFFARREEDNKIFKNMITIHADGFITFTAGHDQINVNKAEEVYQTLKKITKDTGQQVVVQVLGTQEIGSTSFAKYTEYIIEVKYLDLKKLLHMRFSSINEMVCIMQQHYQDDLKITYEETLKKSWFNSHKSKIIEGRKMAIAQIFMKLFNHPVIKSDPGFFLAYLNLPENFYEVARTSYEKRISMGQSATVSGIKRSYLTKKEEKQAFTILCGTQIELGRDLFHDMDNNQSLKKLRDSANRMQIQIHTLTDSQSVKIIITQYDTVEDVCNKVSTLIGLRSNRDFRLFHQIGKKELRVLDHQQILTKLFEFPKSQQDIIVGFVDNLKSTIQKIISPKTQPTLIFKKYYYLPYEIEQHQFRKDLTRLRLLVYQIFSQLCDMKYQLTFDEYLLFLAMLIYIKVDGDLDRKGELGPSIVHKVIPSTVFKLKNYSEEEWLQKCDHHLKRIREEIDKVIQYNRAQLKQNKIKADTVSKMALYFGPKHLCSQIVLNKIKSNPIFGSNIFYVQPHNTCYKKLQQQGRKVAYNMWLAVKVQSLDLLTPSSKQSVLNLRYIDIDRVDVYSESIVIRTAGAIEITYRLNTYQSFQISQLIKYNKALNVTMAKLKQSSDLNVRVKSYRDQLMQYRTSCQSQQENVSMIK